MLALLDDVIGEIVEMKGGGITSDTWVNAPANSLAGLSTITTDHAALILGLAISKLDYEHAEEDAGEVFGQGLHVKASGLLVSNGSTLSIQSGRGRGLASIVRDAEGFYTLTLNFNGNPAPATIAKLSFVPYLGGGDVHAGIWVEPDPVWIWHTYTAGSTTIVFRISQSGSVTDLGLNEGILVEVY